ncbi:MAG: hypothetical protein IRY98_05115, partial [Alicyclobacillaceae bacterium]|nr:hypothetical protein [Alicyclobacillaceae bacterium]
MKAGRDAPVAPGDVIELNLHGVTHDGRGVGRLPVPAGVGKPDGSGGFTLF